LFPDSARATVNGHRATGRSGKGAEHGERSDVKTILQRKVEVDDLELGMYVARLDRPWTDSPFMFQGFVIKSAEELEKLRDLCKFVFVDEEKSEYDDRTLRRSIEVRPKGQVRITRTEWHKLSSEEQKISFEKEVKKAAELRTRTRKYVDQLFKEMRMGFAVDTETAKAVVHELVETITEDADTALWLTNLKNVHEYTAQHSINVSVLSIVFGKHLGFTKDQLKLIGLGALLHDIGKMKVPPEILDKPGKLTPEEFDIIKRHPVDGYQTMKQTGDIPDQALQIIRYHHERVSGRGYPDGLKGDQISTAVLMVAIADVYDAITSDRVYHQSIPAHEALKALYQIAPGEFGKKLMEEFIRCIGIYPIGSVVELSSGDVGVVMSTDPTNKLRPLVMLVRDADGCEYLPRRNVSLSALDKMERGRDWSVRRIVNPVHLGLSMQQIAQEEIFHGSSETILI
jgi:putative nucleotidyltransferase with HDIG domain